MKFPRESEKAAKARGKAIEAERARKRPYSPDYGPYTRCVEDDTFVSDLGCGTYNDERGQQFLRESEKEAIAREEAKAAARADGFYVRPDDSD